MAHDQNIGSAHEVCDRSHGLHQDWTTLRVPQGRSFLGSQFGFFGFPNLVAEVINKGILELVVALRQGRHANAFHDRIRIFQTVTQPARGRIDQHAAGRHSEVFKEDVDLFGEVDVDGR